MIEAQAHIPSEQQIHALQRGCGTKSFLLLRLNAPSALRQSQRMQKKKAIQRASDTHPAATPASPPSPAPSSPALQTSVSHNG